MRQLSRRSLFTIVAIVVAILLVGYRLYSERFTTISIDLEPTDAIVRLDKKTVPRSKLSLTPGTYTIAVSRSGFTSSSQTLKVIKNQPQTLTIYLTPSTKEGFDWLKAHPTDAQKYESISGKEFDAGAQQITDAQPFIRELPFIAPGFEFRIDYGSAKPDSKFPNQPTIYIQASSDEAKADALSWIQSKGYDASQMNIVYTEGEN